MCGNFGVSLYVTLADQILSFGYVAIGERRSNGRKLEMCIITKFPAIILTLNTVWSKYVNVPVPQRTPLKRNLLLRQILPTLDLFYLLDCLAITGLDRTYHAHHFILCVTF